MVNDPVPCFYIRDIPFYGRVCLAPMAGVSDQPHRELVREFGASWSYTEFVGAEQILIGNPKTFRLFEFNEMERPITFQIFGNSPETITPAAIKVLELNPDIIDLNMGCSTQKVSQRGSGAGLLRNLPMAGKIIESLRKNCPIPITAKIRLGWSHDELNYKETVHVLQESGVEAISVHGRTKDMGYRGMADWNAIHEIQSIAKVPVIGNGDIDTSSKIQKRLDETGVNAVLVGRSAIGNPWIFAGIDKKTLSFNEINQVAKRHYNKMKLFYGEDHAYRLFKKYFKAYFMELKNLQKSTEAILRLEDSVNFEKKWNEIKE